MSRDEIMQEVKKVTGNRHFVKKYLPYSDDKAMIFASLHANFDLNRDIEKARFCWRNRISLASV